MMDDFDIYGDLHNIEAEANQERHEVQQLEKKIADLEAIVQAKDQEKQEIIKKNAVLAENISSLLLTAKAELKRKDTIIADLRRQYDDNAFRRKHLHYKEVHRVSKCTQTNYVRQSHIGVQVEQAAVDEIMGQKKSGDRKSHDRDKDRDRSNDRDREKSRHRERDRVRERERNRERDKSQRRDKDQDKYRERDRHKDRYRDREKVQPQHRERDKTGDWYRERDSSRHRNSNERYEDRQHESNKEWKLARGRQKRDQHDLEIRSESRVFRSSTKPNERSIQKEESTQHSKHRKTNMQTRESPVAEVTHAKIGPHTPPLEFCSSYIDVINNRTEQVPLESVMKSGDRDITDQSLYSVRTCSETIAMKIESQSSKVGPVTDPSVCTRRIGECNITEKNVSGCEQHNSVTIFDGAALDNSKPSSIPAVVESGFENEKIIRCQRIQQEDMSVILQPEMGNLENMVITRSLDDCEKRIISSHLEHSFHLKLNQNKTCGGYESVDDATMFEKMQNVCGEPQTIENQAMDRQLMSSSFLETCLEVSDNTNGNFNFVSDNNEVEEHANESICMSEVYRSSRMGTIADVHSLVAQQITKDSSNNGKTNENVQRIEQYCLDTVNKTSSDDMIVKMKEAEITEAFERDKEQERTHEEKDRVDNRYASTNDEEMLVELRLQNATNPMSLNEQSHIPAEKLASGPSTGSLLDSPLISGSVATQFEAQRSTTTNSGENDVQCRMEQAHEFNEFSKRIQCRQSIRARSKSVCIERVSFARVDDDGTCHTLVNSPSKTNETQLLSKTEEHLKNRETNNAVSNYATPSKHKTRNCSANLKLHDSFVAHGNTDGSGSIRNRLRRMFRIERTQKTSKCFGTNKRRLSLDSSQLVSKKQKSESSSTDNTKSSPSLTSKLSDTFFSSIFLPIVSSLDAIHLNDEAHPRRISSQPPTMKNLVMLHSPMKLESSLRLSPDGQNQTQSLMDSLLLSQVKDGDRVGVEKDNGCIAKDLLKKDIEVDNVHFSPQHLLASSTPLMVKPQSRLHRSTSSVPAVLTEDDACTTTMETPNSKSWTAPLEYPLPSVPSSVTADKSSREEMESCRDEHSHKPKNQKLGESVVDKFKSNKSDREESIIAKKSKNRRDTATFNNQEKNITLKNTDHAREDVARAVFKTQDVAKLGNQNTLSYEHNLTPQNTLSLASPTRHESHDHLLSKNQNQSSVTDKARDNGTPLTSRKRSRTSTSPKRRKIDMLQEYDTPSGNAQIELPSSPTDKKKRMYSAVDPVSSEPVATNISSICHVNALLQYKANKQDEVLGGKNNEKYATRNLQTKGEASGSGEKSVDNVIKSASKVKESCVASSSSHVPQAPSLNEDSLRHTRSPNTSIPQDTVERTVSSAKAPEQELDKTNSIKPWSSGSAADKMCNFSLNLSLASTTSAETETSATQKSETPIRFVREMRIVKENPKLMRVYINRRCD